MMLPVLVCSPSHVIADNVACCSSKGMVAWDLFQLTPRSTKKCGIYDRQITPRIDMGDALDVAPLNQFF